MRFAVASCLRTGGPRRSAKKKGNSGARGRVGAQSSPAGKRPSFWRASRCRQRRRRKGVRHPPKRTKTRKKPF